MRQRASRPARGISRLVVTRSPGAHSTGILTAGPLTLKCALGRSGISRNKREGDGATPAGAFKLALGFFRLDRAQRLKCAIAMRPTGPADGWCDDFRSPCYNRPVKLPFHAGHERLWREDGLYNVIFVLDYNFRFRKARAGSAIFFHIAGRGWPPTEGCVAIAPADMPRLIPRLAARVTMTIR